VQRFHHECFHRQFLPELLSASPGYR